MFLKKKGFGGFVELLYWQLASQKLLQGYEIVVF
jgi:hypothetical protein